MLCYVMLCYVILCYTMLCYIMLCYVMLCYVDDYFLYLVRESKTHQHNYVLGILSSCGIETCLIQINTVTWEHCSLVVSGIERFICVISTRVVHSQQLWHWDILWMGNTSCIHALVHKLVLTPIKSGSRIMWLVLLCDLDERV
jgi:hypothetical protein